MDPRWYGENQKQNHKGTSLAVIHSLTFLLWWDPFVSVNMDFFTGVLPSCRLPRTLGKKWGKMLLLFSKAE